MKRKNVAKHTASSPSKKRASMDAYGKSGVDYGAIDPVKILGQTAAVLTQKNLWWGSHVDGQGGESAQLIRMPQGGYLAHVLEGLGTNSIVAQAMYKLTGDPRYFTQSSVSAAMMIFNDLITSGARPLSANMYLAAGNSRWFKDRVRATAIAEGFRLANDMASCVWQGGETPVLSGIISPGAYDIAGSAIGIVEKEEHLIRGDIEPGDVIIGFKSHGPMANGYTLIRKIAKSLPSGYLTAINASGLSFGDAVMRATPSYYAMLRFCQDNNVPIRYAANITGHGWRKFMRANLPLVHRIFRQPRVPSVFKFIQEHGPDGVIPLREMYANYNMGVGFAIWLRRDDAERLVSLPGFEAFDHIHLGSTASSPDGIKRVHVTTHGITFEGDELAIRK